MGGILMAGCTSFAMQGLAHVRRTATMAAPPPNASSGMDGLLRAVRFVQLTTTKSQDGVNKMTHSQGIACRNRPWCWISPMAGVEKAGSAVTEPAEREGLRCRKLEDGWTFPKSPTMEQQER